MKIKTPIFIILIISALTHLNPIFAASLLESEKNTIKVYQKAGYSVVNVSSIKIARRGHWFFDADPIEIPAGAGSGFVWGASLIRY